MPWSFLNPWFWLGALAIAAPIWLHLRRKRETNLVEFSAVRFLEDQPEPRRSPLRLRDLVLFALRVLALVALVAAFAWPYLRGANTAPIKESRVYILDNTLSHQANDGFKRDRDRLLSEVGKGASDTQVAVIELTSVPRVVVSFGESREAAKQKLSRAGAVLPARLLPGGVPASQLAAGQFAGRPETNHPAGGQPGEPMEREREQPALPAPRGD